MPRYCKKCGVDAPDPGQCGEEVGTRHEFVESVTGPNATAVSIASLGTPSKPNAGSLGTTMQSALNVSLKTSSAARLNITGGVEFVKISGKVSESKALGIDHVKKAALLEFVHDFKVEDGGLDTSQQHVLLASLNKLSNTMEWLDTSHGNRSRRVLGPPQHSDGQRSIAFYSSKPDATEALLSIVFEWKITHDKTAMVQFSSLCGQAIERAFAFATNYAWLPSVDVFFVLSGSPSCIGHILVIRDELNNLKTTMVFFESLSDFYQALQTACYRAEQLRTSACGALLGFFNHYKLAPSMQRVRRTTAQKCKHVYSVALAESLVKSKSPAVSTHDFRLCLKLVQLSAEDGDPFSFLYEKKNIQLVFESDVDEEKEDSVGVPYALVAMYNDENGSVVLEELHSKGEEMLKRLLEKSRRFTKAEHKEYENYEAVSALHTVDVPEGWGVLVMIHGATHFNQESKVSQCLTLHSAITERLISGGDLANVLHRIERTLQWQLNNGNLISCDLRPPNVIAFTRTLLDMAKGTYDLSNGVAQATLGDDDGIETKAGRDMSKPNPEDAKALAGSFPCEEGPLVWTLIDYGFCVVDGSTTIPPEGAAWDLMKGVVGGEPGKRIDMSMEPSKWMSMLYNAVIQLQASQLQASQRRL